MKYMKWDRDKDVKDDGCCPKSRMEGAINNMSTIILHSQRFEDRSVCA